MYLVWLLNVEATLRIATRNYRVKVELSSFNIQAEYNNGIVVREWAQVVYSLSLSWFPIPGRNHREWYTIPGSRGLVARLARSITVSGGNATVSPHCILTTTIKCNQGPRLIHLFSHYGQKYAFRGQNSFPASWFKKGFLFLFKSYHAPQKNCKLKKEIDK